MKIREIIILVLASLSVYFAHGQGMTIESGSHLVANGNVALVINDGSFTNNGGFNSGAGSLYMKGSASAANSKIQTSSSLTFNHVVIDKTANGVQLENNINVNGNLDMQSGTLDLNGKILSFYFDGTILNETETNRIWGDSGTIFKGGLLNMPSSADLGNMGLQISSTQNLNVVYVRRIHGTQTINGAPSATRRYKVEYFVPNLTMDYSMKYFDAELNGITESHLQSWNYKTAWEQRDADSQNLTTNIVQVNGATETDTLWALSTGMLKLAPKVLLEGNYSGSGLMTDNLRSKNLIPTTEPYTGLGYTHVGGGGETCDAAVFNVTGDDAIVDWIFLEWRDKTSPNMVVQTRSALLQKDGDIVDVDGVSPIKVPNLAPDDYYLCIFHRNHLPIRTAGLLSLTPTESNYDFSTSMAQAYDKTSVISNDAMKENSGVYLLHRANVNSDNFINIVDFIQAKVNTSPNQSNIYLPFDLNMDGNTNIVDFIITKSQSSPNKSAHID